MSGICDILTGTGQKLLSLLLAMFAARNFYTVYRELPTGKGFEDMVYLPRKKYFFKCVVYKSEIYKSRK